MTASPITTAYLDLSPDIRARAEEIAGNNRPVTWPEVLLLVGTAMTASRWMPIETVRRNKSVIFCCWWKHQPDTPFIAEGYLDWDGVTWRLQNGEPWPADRTAPTHWQPLPAPPATEREAME